MQVTHQTRAVFTRPDLLRSSLLAPPLPKRAYVSQTLLITTAEGVAASATIYSRSTGHVAYCDLLVVVPGDNFASYFATGKATGGGYHKSSAAMQDAIDGIGATLETRTRHRDNLTKRATFTRWTRAHIDGHGDGAMRDALTALAQAAGHKRISKL